MKEPDEKPTVKLAGKDGNAFAIMGCVIAALKSAGADKEYTNKYFEEATAGDYDNLLIVTMHYVEVE